MTTVLIVTFLVLLFLDVPVSFCMLLSSLAALLYFGIDPIMVGLETTRSLATFYAFLAVPFFILSGEIMARGGLSERLIHFVKSAIGHRRVGMPAVTVVSSELFGAVCGASAATCAAIGGIMIPELEKAGYPRRFGAALAACAGTTGALIPPSIAMIIYGTIANISIEHLFIGGIGPGIVLGAGLMYAAARRARKFDVVVEPKVAPGEVLRAAWGAAGAGFLAVIIYAGIIGGIFTATEASAVAVVYALVIGLFVYRQISFRELPEVVLAAAKTTATLSFVLATSALFGWTLGIGKVPELVTVSLIEGTEGMLEAVGGNLSPETSALLHKILILLVLNVVLLLIGTVLDVAPALLILVPVLLPVADAIGMGSGLAAVHFGIIVVTNLLIGVVTPPIGTTLFVAAAVGKVEVAEMIPDTNRLLVSMVIVQLIITYVPFITTFLPSLM